jgi:hypothetical protein
MVGARAKPNFEAEAKQRQKLGGAIGGSKTGKVPANLREASGESSEKAAAVVNVSARSIDSASKVLSQGAPELVKAVDAGKVAVSTAADLAGELSKEEQAEVVAHGEKEILKAAKEIRARRSEERREERTTKLVEISQGNLEMSGGLGLRPVVLYRRQ